MTKEQDELYFQDVMSDLASLITQHGARRVFVDFQAYYPDLFDELRTQINRFPSRPVAVLLRK